MVRMRRRLVLTTAAASACLALAVPATTASSAAATASRTPDQQAADLLKRPALSRPTTVTITPSHTTLHLSTSRDYVVKVAAGAVLTRGVSVLGGHNVVIEAAALHYARPVGSSSGWLTRGLFFKGQSGTTWVSGLTLTGPLNEGIDLDERNTKAVVVLQKVTVGAIKGSYSGHHADLLQTWAGPSKLVVSGFKGTSDYQGFFLTPNQKWKDGPRPKLFWMKSIDLDMRTGVYGLWSDGANAFPLYTRAPMTVHFNRARPSRDQWLWPKPSTGDKTWKAVTGA